MKYVKDGISYEMTGREIKAVTFPKPEETISDYEAAVQSFVDATARERQFRDGVTLASYIGSTEPRWASEAKAFVAWRDGVWLYAYDELGKVQSGARSRPTIEQFMAELAPISWPE